MTEHHRREDFNGFDKHDIEVEHRIAALEANYANLDASVSRVGKAAKEAAEGVVLLRTQIQSLLAPLVERATISKTDLDWIKDRIMPYAVMAAGAGGTIGMFGSWLMERMKHHG